MVYKNTNTVRAKAQLHFHLLVSIAFRCHQDRHGIARTDRQCLAGAVLGGSAPVLRRKLAKVKDRRVL